MIRILMARLFTQAQRKVIYLLSGGRCAACGCFIWPGNWHADHIRPFSKGGLTDMRNAQALCPPCNLAKGSTMPAPSRYFPNGQTAREWQLAFLDKFEGYVEDSLHASVSNRKAFVLNAFPGSGKTFAQLTAMAWLYKEQKIDFIIVCVPSDMLRTQFATEARKFGLFLHEKCNLKIKPEHAGIVLTYQQLNSSATILQLNEWCSKQKVFVSADEMHHLGARNSWGDNFADAFKNSTIRLMTTGTPFRSDGERIPWVRYSGEEIDLGGPYGYSFGYGFNRWNDSLCALYGRSDGQGEGPSVRDVVFHPWDGEVEWDFTKNGETTRYCHRLSDDIDTIYADDDTVKVQTIKSARRRAAIECGSERHPNGTPYVREQIVAAHKQLMEIRQVHYWAGGLIVCQNRKHADAVAKVVEELTGTVPVVIHGEAGDAKRKLNAYKEDTTAQRTPWVIAVKMVTEGVDIKHLRVCVYFTVETAPLFWTQVLGRVIRLEKGPEEQTAHFFQYDDGVDKGVDVRIRKFALEITKELQAVRLKRDKDYDPLKPKPNGNGGSGEFSSWSVECISATGEAHHQVYNGDEHQISELEIYKPIALAWCQPTAKVKSQFDKLPPGTLEQVLENLRSSEKK
jgi:superfamily II DNA or RNA helicase